MRFFTILIIIFFSTLIKIPAFAYENKILLKINNEIITTVDILNEIGYLKSINKNIDNLNNEKIFAIARNSLIKYKIKEIALKKIIQNIEINNEDFNRVLISTYSNTGYTNVSDLLAYLKNFDIKPDFIRNKMTINALWNQFIYDKYSKNIKIDPDKLKENILKNENQIEYLLSEIVFDLKESQTLNEKFKIIENAIKKNGFENSALIYSISETSNNAGNIGWIDENSINKKILEKISKIDIDEYTDPITIPGGYLILKLKEKRISERNLDIDEELNKIVRTKTNEQLNQFSNIFLNKFKKNVIINEL